MKQIIILLIAVCFGASAQQSITKKELTVDSIHARVDSVYLPDETSIGKYRAVNQNDLDTVYAKIGAGGINGTVGINQVPYGNGSNTLAASDSMKWVNGGLDVTGKIGTSTRRYRFHSSFDSTNAIRVNASGNDTVLLVEQDALGDGSIVSNTYALRMAGINATAGTSFTIFYDNNPRLLVHPTYTSLFYQSGDYIDIAEDLIRMGVAGEGVKLEIKPDTVNVYNNLTVDGDIINTPPHAALHRIADTTISATQDVWYKISNFIVKDIEGITRQSDTLQLTKSGYYIIYFTLSFSGSNNETWEIGVFKNGVLVDPSQLRYTSSSDVGNASCPLYVQSDGDDWFSFKIRNTTDNDDPTISRVSVIITSIHLD